MKSNFHGTLNHRFIDGREWLTLDEFSYDDPVIGTVVVPQITIEGQRMGFVTDAASIPQAFWTAIGHPCRFMPAALVHDYLYCLKSHPREVIDGVFHRALLDMGIAPWRAWTMYRAVRTAGGSYWGKRPPMDLAAPGDDFAAI